MAEYSSIEWTQATWNPVTGCTRVSRGCDNCYAATLTKRLAAMGQEKYQGLINDGKLHFNGTVKLHASTLDIPLRQKAPTLFFVNSMSDLFHERVPVSFAAKVFEVMARCQHHTFQILTKRPERMALVVAEILERVDSNQSLELEGHRILPNVWLGTSVEDQETADERISLLRTVPAKVRFLSCEPLLGPIPRLELTGIDWVIVGGESGPRCRPMSEEWVLEIRDQCESAGAHFFFKQWGGRNKKTSGRILEGKTWDSMPVRRTSCTEFASPS